MDLEPGEKLPINDEVLQVHCLFPVLSIASCEELYARYGGTAENAINCIMDEMRKQSYEDIVQFIQSIRLNKENGKRPEDSPEWQVVQTPKRPTLLVELSNKGLNNNKIEAVPANVVLRQSAPKKTLEESKVALSNFLEHPEARLLLCDTYNEIFPKLMMIMRGVPGSGKSTLAGVLLSVSRTGIICSADSYFEDRNGRYTFNRQFLGQAHEECQTTCRTAMSRHVSPIIVDNTNTTVHEMAPYVKMALIHNYKIKLVEPFTTWKSNIKILTKKNIHCVPKESIERMLKRFESTFEHNLVENEIRAMKGAGRVVDYNPEQRTVSRTVNVPGSPSTPRMDVISLSHRIPLSPFPGLVDYEEVRSSPPPPLLSEHLPDFSEICTSSHFSSPRNRKGTAIDLINDDIPDTGVTPSRMAAVFPECSIDKIGSGCELNSEFVKHDTLSFPIGKRRFSSGCSRRNSGSASKTDIWEDLSAEKGSGDEKEPITNADRLLNLFPNCGKDELLHLFQMCNGDINDTISLLLDSGYEMSGEMEKKRYPIHDLSSVDMGPILQEFRREITPDFEGNEAGFKKTKSEYFSEEDRFKMQGARPKTTMHQQIINGDLDSPVSNPDQEDLYIPVDGEDWVDLTIPEEFVQTLTELYGEPNGKLPSSMTESERKIRLPPTIAFDLYKYLSLNILRMENQNKDEVAASQYHYENGRTEMNEAELFAKADEEQMEELLNNIHQMSIETSAETPRLSNIVALERKITSVETAKLETIKSLKRSMAQNINFAQLKLAFPSLNVSVVDDAFVQNGFNYDSTMMSLREVYPSKFVDTALKRENENIVCKSQFPEGEELTYDPDMVSRMTATERREMNDAAHRWKLQYEEYITAVKLYLDKANEHRSQPEVFSYYMVKAAEMKALLKQSQREYWFYTVISLNAGNNDPNKIDLHGLSVNNAIEIVSKFLKNRTAWYQNSPISEAVNVNIITGIGKHSDNRIPKINPAVRNYLRSCHFSYRDQHGNFLVHLTKNRKKSR